MVAVPPAAMVVSLPGSRAASVVWRARGRLHVTVIAKATFGLVPGGDMARAEPQEILTREVHHENLPSRSVRLTADLAPFVPCADVLFTGHAHAPAGARVTSLPLRLAVLSGDRPVLDKRIEARDPAGFVRMQIVYEKALGGDGLAENPFGTREPSLVDPAQPGRAACFAPISWTWPVRKRLLGGLRRSDLEAPIVELPEGFNGAYFQAAPADQQVPALRGDEHVVLEGLVAGAWEVRSRLPDVRGVARVLGREPGSPETGEPLDLTIDTLRLDGDAKTCTVVARASLLVPQESSLSAIRILAGVETAAAPTAWSEALLRLAGPLPSVLISVPGPAREDDSDDATWNRVPAPERAPMSTTLSLGPSRDDAKVGEPAPVLPFQPAAAPPEIASPGAQRAAAPLPGGEETLMLRGLSSAAGRPDMPFVTKGPKVAAPPGAAPSPVVPAVVPAAVPPVSPATAPPPVSSAAPMRAPLRQKAPPSPPVQAAGQGGKAPPASALDASNAALLTSGRSAGAEPPAAARTTAAAPEARADARQALDLVWFDPRIAPRARKQKAWQGLLDALREKPADPDIDDPALHADPAAGEERREIFEILAHGEALGLDGLRAAVQSAVRDDGRFVAPLVLLAGEIALPFDEMEALRSLAGAVAPFASSDDALRSALDTAKELLSTRDVPGSGVLADTLAAKLREAYGKRARALPIAQIDAQVERALLEKRHHQQRTVFGGRHVRALWHLPEAAPARGAAAPAGKSAIPAYLPDALAQVLPMFPRLSVRAVAEAHLAVDLHEPHPVALRVLALARSAPVPVF